MNILVVLYGNASCSMMGWLLLVRFIVLSEPAGCGVKGGPFDAWISLIQRHFSRSEADRIRFDMPIDVQHGCTMGRSLRGA